VPYPRSLTLRLTALEARASGLNAAALASRLRTRPVPTRRSGIDTLAIVHRAFWRADVGDGSAEAYIGPVLRTLEDRLAAKDSIAYVSVGPASNFRARRWWHTLRSTEQPSVVQPIEGYAPLRALTDSRRVGRERRASRDALWKSDDLRALSTINGCDCWPLIREELAGIALLQWPWSARAMDEAAATLDACQPRVAVTYAEAGGWGRAIVLECRRRGITSVGLQHGFIYRHWLNYLHEADEMAADPDRSEDLGFPRPTTTLLFDRYAEAHLVERGRFPPESLAVTGSARLDALAQQMAQLTPSDVDAARAAVGAEPGRALVLVATKHREARGILGPFLAAAAAVTGIHVAIKAHPAEPPEVYHDLVAQQRHVTVLPASAPLAALLKASRAVVTVNSTVALDAALFGLPALVLDLPNNLSPFVDAGIMAGARGKSVQDIRRTLEQILYDEEFRRGLEAEQRRFLARFGIVADGRAAQRAADAITRLAATHVQPSSTT
jgi:hypothetical protein